MKTFEPPRTLEMGGDGNGLYPHGDEKGRSYYYATTYYYYYYYDIPTSYTRVRDNGNVYRIVNRFYN